MKDNHQVRITSYSDETADLTCETCGYVFMADEYTDINYPVTPIVTLAADLLAHATSHITGQLIVTKKGNKTVAQQQMCDGPDGGPAIFLVHNIEQGEVNGFCLGCFADFCQAFLQAVDPARLAPPPAKPARKKRTPAAAAVADDGKDGESGDTQAAAAGRTA